MLQSYFEEGALICICSLIACRFDRQVIKMVADRRSATPVILRESPTINDQKKMVSQANGEKRTMEHEITWKSTRITLNPPNIYKSEQINHS